MEDPVITRPVPTSLPGKRPEDIAQSTDFYLLVGAFVGLLFLAAFAIWLADRWRKRGARGESASLTLSNFRALYDAGELSKEEYEKIRLKMAGRMKTELGVEPPPAPPKSE